MARLSDLVNTNVESTTTDESEEGACLVEALETLIEMANEGELVEEEVAALADAIEAISENEVTEEELVEALDALDENWEEPLDEATLNKMSPKEKMKARKWRKKNKGTLKIQAKKRKMKLKKFSKARKKCLIKIAGKELMGCNSKGKTYRKKKRK